MINTIVDVGQCTRQAERDLDAQARQEARLEPDTCDNCGGPAYREQPVTITRDGRTWTETPVRCRRRCERPYGRAQVRRPGEEKTMQTKSRECPCGCGQPVKPGNKYAGRGCVGKVKFAGPPPTLDTLLATIQALGPDVVAEAIAIQTARARLDERWAALEQKAGEA